VNVAAQLEGEESARDLEKLPARELVRRMLPYFAGHRGQLALAALLVLLSVGVTLCAPLLLGQLVDLTSGSQRAGLELVPVERTRDGLLVLVGLFVGALTLAFALEIALGFLMARVGVAVVMELKGDLLEHVLTLDLDFYDRMTPGRLIARIESDTQSLKNLFSRTGQQMVRALMTCLGIIGIMLWREPRTAMLIVPIMLVAGGAAVFYIRIVRHHFLRSRRALALMTSHIAEQVQGIEVIQHHGLEEASAAELRRLNWSRFRADRTASLLNYGFIGFLAACEVGGAAAIVAIGAGQVTAGALSLGTLVALVDYLRRIFMPIQMLSEFVGHLQQGAVAASRIFGILALRPRQRASRTSEADPALEHSLAIDQVDFSYDGESLVLEGLDLEIRRGMRIALVGPSGGGKSTLARMLLAFHDPGAGRIAVDDVDLCEIPRARWREHVGLVLQETYLFPGTLRDNLTVFDGSIPDSTVARACERVGADALVDRMEDGLDSILDERGRNLSHGERQLVSLARSVVGEPELLVLDEATSAIDPQTEEQLQRGLEHALEGRTAVIVAHRLSTIRSCDLIVVIAGGRIVERGTHDELWARTGGLYRGFAELQLALEGGGSTEAGS
jgi:ATP-binding cassette subfamily B protein